MTIESVEAFPVRLPRDFGAATGTAGSPAPLTAGTSRYRWSATYPALYSVDFETALVRVRLNNGLIGWGEAQAPLAPEVACTIIERLLAPVLAGLDFDGSQTALAALWDRMYSTMRVRGQTGGFMLDAISGVDLALWDLAGKLAGKPACCLMRGGIAKTMVPAYLSGLAGDTIERQIRFARNHPGFQHFKVFLGTSTREVLETMDALRAEFGPDVRVAVDALWHLPEDEAAGFGRELDRRNALWLECPFPPEDPRPHSKLAQAIATPIALGESYRTRHEMAPFFRENAVGILQPDLGRTGITEALRLAEMAGEHGVTVVPHVSIALAPQVAAAVHFAAAEPRCEMAEYNPRVIETANAFANPGLEFRERSFLTPGGVGLGVELRFQELLHACAT